MSRIEDPTTAREFEDLEERVEKLEQSLKGTRESSSSKNADKQENSYRVIKADGDHFVEFKTKEGWVRSDSSNFKIR